MSTQELPTRWTHVGRQPVHVLEEEDAQSGLKTKHIWIIIIALAAAALATLLACIPVWLRMGRGS
ncbi:hypothetical protein CC80DRAFT_552388 [Byssothecium circinans]|uniref:Uncharacterized protein n=1 Tax=Byssothecium circinans TaxID=147558 RepID=A0A6A5TP48_9PLEO|nr:hypothetical protein CC80DRAFT_552388 [Byssothecium circinans]